VLRHVFKMVWNRKKANVLVGVEIFFSFLVLIGVLTMAIVTLDAVRYPLGFAVQDVWHVSIDQRYEEGQLPTEDQHAMLSRLVDAAKAIPQVAEAAATQNVPYTNMTMRDRAHPANGQELRFDFAQASDALKDVLSLTLAKGRWFSREDDGAPWIPTVVNARLAKELFGNADPIGKEIPREPRKSGDRTEPEKARKIVGVLAAYRVEGKYQTPRHYAFYRADLRAPQTGRSFPLDLAIRVRPGTPRSFEATLARALHAAAPNLNFDIESLPEAEKTKNREMLIPIAVGFILSGFLLLMVALGLTGVLWESVTRRTREIGVRRAVGASGARVARQLVLEICAVTSFAVAVGAVFAGQMPILHLLGSLPVSVFAAGILGATLGLYALSSLCALYPGWLATRVTPSRALRDE
jgi:putative ABC transport system permease protein